MMTISASPTNLLVPGTRVPTSASASVLYHDVTAKTWRDVTSHCESYRKTVREPLLEYRDFFISKKLVQYIQNERPNVCYYIANWVVWWSAERGLAMTSSLAARPDSWGKRVNICKESLSECDAASSRMISALKLSAVSFLRGGINYSKQYLSYWQPQNSSVIGTISSVTLESDVRGWRENAFICCVTKHHLLCPTF